MKQTERRRGILFLNLGGPETLKDVKPFLYRLFEDKEVIRIPFTPLRKFVAWAISTSREKTSQDLYRQIGGGSPIRKYTDRQAELTEIALEKRGLSCLVETAFTCSEPLVEDSVKKLASRGVTRFLAFPLYPQYSLTTTKSALERSRHAVRKFAPGASLTEICSWPDEPKFIDAHVQIIRDTVHSFREKDPSKIHLLFSAHSIPEKLVTELNDPYKDQVEQTVREIVKKLGWMGKWELAWQSKLGPMKWLSPSTAGRIPALAREGVENVVVIPVAFVSDHIETLCEIDIQFAELARDAGIKEFKKTPGLNENPLFIEALADLAERQKEFWVQENV